MLRSSPSSCCKLQEAGACNVPYILFSLILSLARRNAVTLASSGQRRSSSNGCAPTLRCRVALRRRLSLQTHTAAQSCIADSSASWFGSNERVLISASVHASGQARRDDTGPDDPADADSCRDTLSGQFRLNYADQSQPTCIHMQGVCMPRTPHR